MRPPRPCAIPEGMLVSPVTVKDLSKGLIKGLAIPFGGPVNGRDLEGEAFTKDTEFRLDWFSERPLLYQHGWDKELRLAVVGRQTKATVQERGIWAEAQLDMAHEYAKDVAGLLGKQALYFSSGAHPNHVRTTSAGLITEWPWIELSLTPTPANPYAVINVGRTAKAFKAVGLDVPKLAAKESTISLGFGGDDGHMYINLDDLGDSEAMDDLKEALLRQALAKVQTGMPLKTLVDEVVKRLRERETGSEQTTPDPIDSLWLDWQRERTLA